MSTQRRDRAASASTSEERGGTARNVRSFADFREETIGSDPYRLDLGDGDVIDIHAPDTVEQVIGLSEVGHSPREVLRILCGEHYDRVYEAVRAEQVTVLNAFLRDLADHFGMGALPPDGGGS